MKCKPDVVCLSDDTSLPVRGAWIEIFYAFKALESATSLPVRGAWIEMEQMGHMPGLIAVAPRAGSVD